MARRVNSIEAMGDLFGGPRLPEGFSYQSDVISLAEEASLVRRFEKLPLTPFEFHGHLGNRRIMAFGHRYLFAGQTARDEASRIPDWLMPLTEIAGMMSGKPATAFQQVMVTEYAPGAGIGWHRDRPTYDEIVAISFLAPCSLRLRKREGEGWDRQSAWIEPRSAYLLQGKVRNIWQHSITPMDALRYSVTLRTFRPGHGVGDDPKTKGSARGSAAKESLAAT